MPALFDQILKPALDSVTNIIGEFHESPEDKAKAQLALVQASNQLQIAAMEYDAKLNEDASANIRADASSNDKYTMRARPTFMYIVEAILVFNYIGIPLAMLFGAKMQPILLPSDLLMLFGVCVSGYAISRTVEKALALPGDSQLSFLGLKVGNKS